MRQGCRLVLTLIIVMHLCNLYTVDFSLTSVLYSPHKSILEINGVSGLRMGMTKGLLSFGWLGFEKGTWVAQTELTG